MSGPRAASKLTTHARHQRKLMDDTSARGWGPFVQTCRAAEPQGRTPAISGSRPWTFHQGRFYRESAALLRSANAFTSSPNTVPALSNGLRVPCLSIDLDGNAMSTTYPPLISDKLGLPILFPILHKQPQESLRCDPERSSTLSG